MRLGYVNSLRSELQGSNCFCRNGKIGLRCDPEMWTMDGGTELQGAIAQSLAGAELAGIYGLPHDELPLDGL